MRLQTLLEARWILVLLVLLAIASSFATLWLSLFFLVPIFCTLAFFRDPDRPAPADRHVSRQIAHLALATGDRAQVRQSRPHHRAARDPQDRAADERR